MALFSTDFSENPVQAGTPSGWTQRIKAAAGASSAITNTADGKVFRLNTSTGGSYVFSFNVVNGEQDVDTLSLFRVVDTGQVGRFGINYARYGGTSEATTIGYNISFTQVSSVLSMILSEDSTGTVAWLNKPWSLNTWYYCRLRVRRNRISTKLWPRDSVEPVAWDIDQQHTGPTISSPYSGVGDFVQNSAIEYKYFAAATNGDISFKMGDSYAARVNTLRNITFDDITWDPTDNYTEGRTLPLTDISVHWWNEPSVNPTLAGVVSWFKDPVSDVSAHFVVSGTQIINMVSIDDTAWHTYMNNAYTIGIEIDPNLPPGTYETVAALVRFLRNYTGKALPIRGHSEFPSNESTTCPGTLSPGFIQGLSELPIVQSSVSKTWDGSKWEQHPLRVWDGSEWVFRDDKTWNGSQWI